MSEGVDIITIDGPSASGKTTVSREVAKRLGWSWVSTGSFYRAIAYLTKEQGLDPKDEAAIVNMIRSVDWKIEMESERTGIYFQGDDVTSDAHKESIGSVASQVSQLPKVREALLEPQRKCAEKASNGLIAEGRDCGTVVFPQAGLKIYLTARDESRYQRRADEEGEAADTDALKAAQAERDKRDSEREVAPLQVSDDAHVIDTSDLTLDQVVDKIVKIAKSR